MIYGFLLNVVSSYIGGFWIDFWILKRSKNLKNLEIWLKEMDISKSTINFKT